MMSRAFGPKMFAKYFFSAIIVAGGKNENCKSANRIFFSPNLASNLQRTFHRKSTWDLPPGQTESGVQNLGS